MPNINSHMTSDNVTEYFLAYELFDSMILELQGTELSENQVLKVSNMLQSVQTFQDGFIWNDWSLAGKRISIPLFFILCDLVATYDEQVMKMVRIVDSTKAIMDGALVGMSPHAINIRYNALLMQTVRTRDSIIALTNEILNFIHELLTFFQDDDCGIFD